MVVCCCRCQSLSFTVSLSLLRCAALVVYPFGPWASWVAELTSAPWCLEVKSWAGTRAGDQTDPSPQTWLVRNHKYSPDPPPSPHTHSHTQEPPYRKTEESNKERGPQCKAKALVTPPLRCPNYLQWLWNKYFLCHTLYFSVVCHFPPSFLGIFGRKCVIDRSLITDQ